MGCCRAHHYISHIWVSQRQQRTMQTKHLHFCFWNPLPQVALWSCFHEEAPDNFGKSAGTARATAHHLNIIKTKARHFPNAYFLSISIQSITLLGIIFNGFCFINLIPHFFDYLMCPYYPAYTMGCYQIVIGGDNGG